MDTDKPCDENQVVVNAASEVTGCVCAPGTVPDADGQGCSECSEHEEAVGGMCVCADGFARPSAQAACEEVADAGSTDEDAGDEPMGSEPTGVGMPCESAADCAGYDATFCQTLQEPHQCLLQGCEVGDVVCPDTDECCVIDVIPALKAADGLCVPAGECIAPGMVVTP